MPPGERAADKVASLRAQDLPEFSKRLVGTSPLEAQWARMVVAALEGALKEVPDAGF